MKKWEYVDQSNDASSINNKRGMARRAKRKSSKKLRRKLKESERSEP